MFGDAGVGAIKLEPPTTRKRNVIFTGTSLVEACQCEKNYEPVFHKFVVFFDAANDCCFENWIGFIR